MKHARILIIEDDADTADMLKIFFSSQGSSVDIASTGDRALDTVRNNQPDLIILDIMLPDMDGYTVCQKLRSSPNSMHIPILFLTQKTGRNDILSGLEIGADDYLTKPFDLEELRLRARNALQRSRTYRKYDPRTSFPTGDLIRAALSRQLSRSGWAVLVCRIKDFERLRKTHGLLTGDDLLSRTADRLENAIRRVDNSNPFIGYMRGGDFLLITRVELADQMRVECLREFQKISSENDPVVPHSDGAAPDGVSKPETTVTESEPQMEFGLLKDADGPFEDVDALLRALSATLDDRNESAD